MCLQVIQRPEGMGRGASYFLLPSAKGGRYGRCKLAGPRAAWQVTVRHPPPSSVPGCDPKVPLHTWVGGALIYPGAAYLLTFQNGPTKACSFGSCCDTSQNLPARDPGKQWGAPPPRDSHSHSATCCFLPFKLDSSRASSTQERPCCTCFGKVFS